MSVFHDEVEIEDFEYDEETETYSYPCPCGDRFLITREDLENGEDVATCPSCSLILRVIYDQVDIKHMTGFCSKGLCILEKYISCHMYFRSFEKYHPNWQQVNI
uniref:Diphthamide biosynthesis protein 3 n=1 Tax=Accipiter nisus TaxID=211598 RepID=A0A8B9NCC8_9AVES